jgi:hypothetical protein
MIGFQFAYRYFKKGDSSKVVENACYCNKKTAPKGGKL